MDCITIIKEYLENNGYDGLCTTECGCRIDDLCPCDEGFADCSPGYLIDKNTPGAIEAGFDFDECDYYIVDKKPELKID